MADRALAVTSRSLDLPGVAVTATMVPALAGYVIRVVGLSLNAAGVNQVSMQDAHQTFFTAYLTADKTVEMAQAEHGWFDTTSGDPLQIVLQAAVAISGRLVYQYVPEHWEP